MGQDDKTGGDRCPTCNRTDRDWLAEIDAAQTEDTARLRATHKVLRETLDQALRQEYGPEEFDALPPSVRKALRNGAYALALLSGIVTSTQLLLEALLFLDHDEVIQVPSDYLKRIYNQLTLLGMAPPR